MHSTKPQLLPTLICLAIVGLMAAILPYPGLEQGLNLINTQSSESK